MTKTHALCCCSIVIVLLLALAAADTNAPFDQKILALDAQADTNGDGILTDTDEDSTISLAPQRYPGADRNADGVLSHAEKRQLRMLTHGPPQQPASPHTVAAAVTTFPGSTPIHSTGMESPLRQGPHPVKSGEHGIGRQIPDLVFTDIAGKQHKLSDFASHKALAFAMTGTGCPLCLKYAPSLAAIEQQYLERGVAFIFVNPNESEQLEQLQDVVNTHGLQGPYVRDGKQQLLEALVAETTTEVFLLDRARTLVYRGAVDDQYGFSYALDAPRTSYLTDALDAVLALRTPRIQATTAPGCELFYEKTNESQTFVTYHNRISRIVQANCIECHRKDGIAPISLESYEEVKDYAGMIRNVIQRGIMPPWFAAPQPPGKKAEKHSLHWSNDRSLSAQEKSDLFAWIQAGAPEGDPANAPMLKTFPGGWLIGNPDAVFEFPRPLPIKATGIMPYKHVTVETNLAEDKWVQAIEVRPGKPAVVHHVIVSLQEGEGKPDERNGYWAAYVPGNSTLVYPDGYVRRLPKGAKLRFQMHYTPNGTATEDSTRIGLVFARQSPRHEVHVAVLANSQINIPPHAGNHREVAELRLPYDVQILSFLPHMHLRGKAARYEAFTVHGAETLLDIPRYDFNWQLLYRLAEPQMLQRGDTIRFTGWFDNSLNNPANPAPDKTVRWGRQTEDEMHIGYVEYIVPGAKPGEPVARIKSRRSVSGRRNTISRGELRIGGQSIKTTVLIRTLRKLDKNHDGKLQQTEVPQKRQSFFDLLDTNRDHVVTTDEVRETIRTQKNGGISGHREDKDH